MGVLVDPLHSFMRIANYATQFFTLTSSHSHRQLYFIAAELMWSCLCVVWREQRSNTKGLKFKLFYFPELAKLLVEEFVERAT